MGVTAPDDSDLLDDIRTAGGEPVPLEIPEARPRGGVALTREWVADFAEISYQDLDALLIDAEHPEELAGLLISAMRLNLPAVCSARREGAFSVALAALGLVPLASEAGETVVEVARAGGPGPGGLIGSFSLANALRAGLSAGGGPELLVHLLALAREAGTLGFSKMVRVIAPETPAVTDPASGWFQEHGTESLLAFLGDALYDAPTVAGRLKEALPPAPPAPDTTSSRLTFVRGRTSGTEAVCRVRENIEEAAGHCRVFFSEEPAVRAALEGELDPASFLVVGGCGSRGGPGLSKLDRLARALAEAGLEGRVPVITDGLAPDGAMGVWISLTTPEAATDGIIGRLQDGDFLRIDFEERRILAGIEPGDLASREPYEADELPVTGYAARYARSALPALEGAGFG